MACCHNKSFNDKYFPTLGGGIREHRASHAWPHGGHHDAGGRSASQAVVIPLLPPLDSSRRWSMAAQSVANQSIASSVTGVDRGHPSLDKQPSLQSSKVPPETMSALVNNTHPNSSGDGRKISFVIQDDGESKSSSQTTLAMQVITLICKSINMLCTYNRYISHVLLLIVFHLSFFMNSILSKC